MTIDKDNNSNKPITVDVCKVFKGQFKMFENVSPNVSNYFSAANSAVALSVENPLLIATVVLRRRNFIT